MAIGDVSVSVVNPISFKGAYFDGVDDKVTLGTTDILVYSQSFSITSDFIFNSLDGNSTTLNTIIADNTSAANKYWGLYIRGDGKILWRTFLVGGGTTDILSTSILISENTKYNIIVLINRTSNLISIYLNGDSISLDITDISLQVGLGTHSYFIGSERGTGQFCKGFLSNIGLYQRLLNSSEISKIAAGDKVLTDVDLKAYYPLYEDYNSTTGYFNGTNTGSVLVNFDTVLAADIAGKRAGATDKYFITEVNGKILSASIAES